MTSTIDAIIADKDSLHFKASGAISQLSRELTLVVSGEVAGWNPREEYGYSGLLQQMSEAYMAVVAKELQFEIARDNNTWSRAGYRRTLEHAEKRLGHAIGRRAISAIHEETQRLRQAGEIFAPEQVEDYI